MKRAKHRVKLILDGFGQQIKVAVQFVCVVCVGLGRRFGEFLACIANELGVIDREQFQLSLHHVVELSSSKPAHARLFPQRCELYRTARGAVVVRRRSQ